MLQADAAILTPRSAPQGGSKCGATSGVAAVLEHELGEHKLITANVGDVRVLLIRDGGRCSLRILQLKDVGGAATFSLC